MEARLDDARQPGAEPADTAQCSSPDTLVAASLKASTPTSPSTGKWPSSLENKSSMPAPTPAEPWLSPLDRFSLRVRTRDSAQAGETKDSAHPDAKRPGDIDLDELREKPTFRRGPGSPTTRMPFHGDESFPGTPQLSPEMPGSSFIRDKGSGVQSSIHLLPYGQHSPGPTRSVSFVTPVRIDSHPSPEFSRTRTYSNGGWNNGQPSPGLSPGWHPSFTMYICFIFGILCAVGHHIFYSSLHGKIAERQSEMLRYGTLLAYGAKAGFSAAVISAFKQRVWVTVRSRFMSISALDSMFAAAEDMVAMLDYEFLRDAKAAWALALFAWTTPLVVILTSNTLLVEPRTMSQSTKCPAVRTLNFTFEETYEWRAPIMINGLYEIPVSIWNTTRREDDSDPDWFDYYTGPSAAFQSSATLGAFLEEVVPRKNASYDTCGSGWNCTFFIEFTGPGYQCTELASGVGAVPKNLSQESGEAVPPFQNTDFLLPRGDYSYYAFTSGGEYSPVQLENVSIGGIPNMDPSDYPASLGALRTEPIIWVGYSVVNNPNQTQPFRNESTWADAFTPKIFACEHHETNYSANFTYVNAEQYASITKRTFGSPIINTTFQPGVMADDGTNDNTTATPTSNYIFPRDVARYRRTAAYHSYGKMLRGFINGTVTVSDALVQAIENTAAVQTKLLDQRNNYFPYADLMDRVQSLYDDIILSTFANPQFVEVAWAQRPAEMSGTLLQGGLNLKGDDDDVDDEDLEAYMYPCTRFRTGNTFAYQVRDLWMVYGVATLLTLACTAAGALAIRDNGGVTRNTRFSSIVAATRGPALEKIAWQGPLQDRGDVPAEVKRFRLGYGVMADMSSGARFAAGLEPDPNLVEEDGVSGGVGGVGMGKGYSTGYSSGFVSDMRCGFGLKGDVDQRHREGSLFHR